MRTLSLANKLPLHLELLALALASTACFAPVGNDPTDTDASSSGGSIVPSTGETPPTSETTEATDTPTTTGTPTTTEDPTAAVDGPLCFNFGGQAGVEAVIGSFVGKVLANDKINAYFLTTGTDGANLDSCLSTQVGEAVGCAGVVYGCMDMKTVHAGMGISTQDFNDLAADFVAAMTSRTLSRSLSVVWVATTSALQSLHRAAPRWLPCRGSACRQPAGCDTGLVGELLRRCRGSAPRRRTTHGGARRHLDRGRRGGC